VSTKITAILDAGIAALQRLRKSSGGAQTAEEDGDRSRSRTDKSGGRQGAAQPTAETAAAPPKSNRRLRTFLIYVCLLLAGGMAGGALAYNLLENLLGKQSAESRRLEAAAAKNAKSSTDIQNALEDEKLKRAEAEKKLASSLAEYVKTTAEKQRRLDAMEQKLATLLAGERTRNVPRLSPASHTAGKARTLKTGDCVLDTKNIASLKGCIDEFNR
jgi:hypothetical protein